MHKKNVLIGLTIGLIANIIGLLIITQIFGKGDGIFKVLNNAIANDFLGKLLSLAAVLNIITFFYFILKKQDAKAKGVLLATMLIALLTLLLKFF